MLKYFYIVILLVIALQFVSAENRQTPLLVTSAWLSEHLNDSNLVLIQVCQLRSEYAKGHIPGARFLWFGHISPNNPDESIGLPSIEQAKNILEELGVSNNSCIVLYGGSKTMALVTRTFLMLDYLGIASNVSILDGGLEAWKADGKALSKEPSVAAHRGKIVLKQTQSVVNAGWVKAHLKDTMVCIVDSRGKAAFDGLPSSPGRTGHIAGARNIPSAGMLDSLNRFKSIDEIRKSIAGGGVHLGTKVVSYCNVGLSASIFYVAAKLAGYDAAVYDGSWEDWAERGDDYPTEATPPVPPTDSSAVHKK